MNRFLVLSSLLISAGFAHADSVPVTASPAPPPKPAPVKVENPLIHAIRYNVALRGAMQEAKTTVGAPHCQSIRILEQVDGKFKAVIDCNRVSSGTGPVSSEATGQLQVSGAFDGKNIAIERIEFSYAG